MNTNKSNILSPQETDLLRSIAQVGATRATQLVAFYESVFTASSVHSVSERTKNVAVKQLMSAFPTLGKKPGRKVNPNSVLRKVTAGVYSAIDTGINQRREIISFIKKVYPELQVKHIIANIYAAKGINRKYGVWNRA